MKTYVLFLRGINVGGHKKVPMADLRALLAELGFENVGTILASGNAWFEAQDQTEAELLDVIMPAFEKRFGFKVAMMIFLGDMVKRWFESSPFAGFELDKSLRGYVTFVEAGVKAPWSLPHDALDGHLKILNQQGRAVFSVIDHSAKVGSPDAMKVWEEALGKNITTRTWATMERIMGKLK
jgi:uncharacterized protein (DUF1697 family)